MGSQNWRDIWNKRRFPDSECSVLQKLIYLDGFDNGAGKIDEQNWEKYINYIKNKIQIASNESIFEVGCGSGAFLYPFYLMNIKIGGIDYSKPLIKKAKSIFTGMSFTVCNALNLNTDKKYDIVISNSVFHYFLNYNYANTILEKMLCKAQSRIAILEIPNAALMNESENVRRKMCSLGEYDKKYNNLKHLYYDKQYFYNFAEEHKCSCSVFDQNIQGYGNNRYRFNCIIKK